MASEPTSLVEIVYERAQQFPQSTFLIEEPNTRTVTYSDAMFQVTEYRTELGRAGVTAGDVVGMYMGNTVTWVLASLAAWSLGAQVAACGVAVPPERARELFARVSPRVVLEGNGTSVGWNGIRLALVAERTDGGRCFRRTSDVADRWHLPTFGEVAVVFFSSGTTGDPKTVRHTHGYLINSARQVANVYAKRSGYRPGPAPPELPPGLILSPYGHATGYGQLAFRMWIGRRIVLIPRFAVRAIQDVVAKYAFESLHLTPTMVFMLATADEPVDLASLRYVTCGTAPLTVSTRNAFEARYGIPVLQAYGMTETGPLAQERLEDVQAGRRGPGSVGRPATGVKLRICLPNGEEAPAGVDGEVVVSTSVDSGGSLRPPDPKLDGWFNTGDVGHLSSEGILFISGRLSDRIIVGGFNVDPAEVEAVIRETDLVRDVVVVGLADERLGEKPVACVIWSRQEAVDDLERRIRTKLPAYKVPRSYLAFDDLPLTLAGKVDRRVIASLAGEILGVSSREPA